MNNDIRKYIELVETAQSHSANTSKIARLITGTNNKMGFSGSRVVRGHILLKNPNAGISIYGVPIKIDVVTISYINTGLHTSIAIYLEYIANSELRIKVENAAIAAGSTNRSLEFHDIVQEYIEYHDEGTNQLVEFINKLNFGFSSNAISDLKRYKLGVESTEDDEGREFTIGVSLSVPDCQLIKEFESALRYKISMDDFDR